VNNRLKSIYGNNYGLRIESMPGSYTRVMIPIPLRKEETRETESIAG
jgi:LytS/YehU family sensor histidine kinase